MGKSSGGASGGDAAFASARGRRFVPTRCDAGRPVADFLTVEDVRGRLLERSELSGLTDFDELHSDAGAVLPLRVWRALAHRGGRTAPVWVSADAFLQKLHAAVDRSSSDLLGACDCCLSRFGCTEDVVAYHRGFALALVDDGQLTAPAWSADRDDAMHRYLETLLPAGWPFEAAYADGWYGLGVWRVESSGLSLWTFLDPVAGFALAPTPGAEHETHFASPDHAAIFHLGRTLPAIAEPR
jgi:hypothetical protein